MTVTTVSSTVPATPRGRSGQASTGTTAEDFAALMAGLGAVAAPTAVPTEAPATGTAATGTGTLGAAPALLLTPPNLRAATGTAASPELTAAAPSDVDVTGAAVAATTAVDTTTVETPGAAPSAAPVVDLRGAAPSAVHTVAATSAVTVQAAAVAEAARGTTTAAQPTAVPTAPDATSQPVALETPAPATATSVEVPEAGAATATSVEVPEAGAAVHDADLEQAPVDDVAPVAAVVEQTQPTPEAALPTALPVTPQAASELRRVETALVAPPTPAAPPAPVEQVAQALGPVLQGPDGTYNLTLELYPEELGAVQVELALRNGEITLALHAVEDSAQETLRSALADLKAELEAQGLTATSLTVDGGRADDRSGRDPQGHPSGSGGGSGDADSAGGTAVPTSDPDAALDVRI